VVGSDDSDLQVILGATDAWPLAPLQTPTSQPAIFGIDIGDFNEDGMVDVFAGTSLLIGNSDGTFAETTVLSEFQGGGEVVGGDFNGDGHRDVVIFAFGNATLLHGDGAGGFAAAHLFDVGSNVEASDLDGDGVDDLVFRPGGALGRPSLAILPGNPSGTYLERIQESEGDNPVIGVADVTLDGIPDLVLSYFVSAGGALVQPRIVVQAGRGDLTFEPPRTSNTVSFAEGGLVAHDFDGDGDSDVLYINGSRDAAIDDDVLSIVWNRLEGRAFDDTTIEPLPAVEGLPPNIRMSPLLADVDRDGLDDVLLVGRNVVWVSLGRDRPTP